MAMQKEGIGGCKDTEARSVMVLRVSLSLCSKFERMRAGDCVVLISMATMWN